LKRQWPGFLLDAILERTDKIAFRVLFAPIVAPSKNFLVRFGAPHGVRGLAVALSIVLVREQTMQDLDQERIRLPFDPVFDFANDLGTAPFAPQPVSPALNIIELLRIAHSVRSDCLNGSATSIAPLAIQAAIMGQNRNKGKRRAASTQARP